MCFEHNFYTFLCKRIFRDEYCLMTLTHFVSELEQIIEEKSIRLLLERMISGPMAFLNRLDFNFAQKACVVDMISV